MLLIIFLLGLALRVLWIASLDNRVDDWGEEGVKEAAWSLIEGRGYSMPRSVSCYPGDTPLYSWREPGFSLILVPVFRLFGENYLAVKILLAILSSLTAVFTYLLGRDLFDSEPVARLAAFGMAVLPESIHWTGYLTPESVTIFVLILPVFFLVRGLRRPAPVNPAAAGLLLGVAALTRAQAIVLMPFLLAAYFIGRRDPRRAGREVFLAGGLALLVFSPWVIRNYRIHKQLVVMPTVAGEVLYIANNPGAVRMMKTPAGFFHGEEPERRFIGRSELEISRWYRRAALGFILSRPGDYARLAADRFVRFWRFYPHRGVGVSGRYYNILHLLVSLLTSGVAITLFLPGVFLSRRHWRRTLIPLVLVVVFSTLTVMARATIRYRLPLMPYVMIFAAFAFVRLVEWRRRGPVPREVGHVA